jgi:hypothetical protein
MPAVRLGGLSKTPELSKMIYGIRKKSKANRVAHKPAGQLAVHSTQHRLRPHRLRPQRYRKNRLKHFRDRKLRLKSRDRRLPSLSPLAQRIKP